MNSTAFPREPTSLDAEPDQLHDAQRARGDLNSSIQHDRASHRRLEDDAPGDGAQGIGARGKDNVADGCVGECTGQTGAVAHRRGPRRIRLRRGRRRQGRRRQGRRRGRRRRGRRLRGRRRRRRRRGPRRPGRRRRGRGRRRRRRWWGWRRRGRRHSRTAVGAVGAEGAVAPLRSGSTIVACTIRGKVTHIRAGLCAGEAHQHGEEDDAGESRRGPKADRRAAPSRESARTRGDDPDAMMLIEPLVSTGGGCRGSEHTCQPVQTRLPAADEHG